MGKLLALFPKIIYKGEKINLDSDTISLKNLMPGNDFLILKYYLEE
jgi:hypothetical protein